MNTLISPQDGIRDARQTAKDASAAIANKIESVVGQTRDTARQGLDTVKNAVQQTRDSVSDSSEAIVTYTRENPVKALLIAAASGAFLWTLLKAVGPSRH